MNRTQRIQVVAGVLGLAGIVMTTARIIAHEDGQPYSWRFFAGLGIGIVGAAVYGAALLHSATDREAIYRLGYTAGRVDTIREMNRAAQVVPLTPRSAAGHPTIRARRGTARAGRADTPV